MAQTAKAGKAAGAVAALACQYKTTPIEVPVEEVRALIKEHGGIVPEQPVHI